MCRGWKCSRTVLLLLQARRRVVAKRHLTTKLLVNLEFEPGPLSAVSTKSYGVNNSIIQSKSEIFIQYIVVGINWNFRTGSKILFWTLLFFSPHISHFPLIIFVRFGKLGRWKKRLNNRNPFLYYPPFATTNLALSPCYITLPT